MSLSGGRKIKRLQKNLCQEHKTDGISTKLEKIGSFKWLCTRSQVYFSENCLLFEKIETYFDINALNRC